MDNVNITQGKLKHIFVQVLYRKVIRVDNALGAAERKKLIMILYCVNGKCFLTDISSTPNC